MIHTFNSERFGDVTYDDITCVLRQNGNVREHSNAPYSYLLYDRLHSLNRVICRIRFDADKAVSYLDCLDYVQDSSSVFNYNSFAKAAEFVKNANRSEGNEVFVAGERFYCYTEKAFAQAYAPKDSKKVAIKVSSNDVLFL